MNEEKSAGKKKEKKNRKPTTTENQPRVDPDRCDICPATGLYTVTGKSKEIVARFFSSLSLSLLSEHRPRINFADIFFKEGQN